MKIKRTLYVETDINRESTVEFFPTMDAAREYAKLQLTEAIHSILGADYVIPEKDVDADGYIHHFPVMSDTEISSSEWGWTVCKGDDTALSSIEEVEIELTPEERYTVWREVDRENLREGAKHALFEFLNYQEDPDEGSYWAARDAIVEEHLWETYGVSVQELVQPKSKFFILDSMVVLFEERQDSNLGDWDVWEQIVRDTLQKREEAYKKEGPAAGRTWYAVSATNGESWEKRWIGWVEAAEQRDHGMIAVRINNKEDQNNGK